MEALIKLDSTHREQLAAHLLALNRDDRADRFMGIVSDDYVQRYIAGIGYACDVLIGALQGRRLVAASPQAEPGTCLSSCASTTSAPPRPAVMRGREPQRKIDPDHHSYQMGFMRTTGRSAGRRQHDCRQHAPAVPPYQPEVR